MLFLIMLTVQYLPSNLRLMATSGRRSISLTVVGLVLAAGDLTPMAAQFTQQGAKLTGTGFTSPGASQGWSVAISADGNTALVGGPLDNPLLTSNARGGAAWVFTRTGGVWSQQGSKLAVTSSQTSLEQGTSVALSADGNTALVGTQNGSAADVEGAWVFVRTGDRWLQQGPILTKPLPYQRNLGNSVALSGDGNTAVLSGNRDCTGVGDASIFVRAGGVWSLQAELTVAGNVGVISIPRVAISADGTTVAIGQQWDNNITGAVWIFSRSGSQWTQQGSKLVGSGAVGAAGQGQAVALSADGNTLISGGPHDNSFGAVWFFTRTAGVWTQQGNKLSAADTDISMGSSVSLSADGDTALAGSPFSSGGGSVRFLKRTGGVWSRQGPSLIGSGFSGTPLMGLSVALSGDGGTALAGGPNDTAIAVDQHTEGIGAAWVFVRTAIVVSGSPSAVAGVPINFNVTATGPGNLVQSSYSPTLSLTSTDVKASFSPQLTLASGAGSFSTTFQTPGTQTMTAIDSATPFLTGTSNSVSVRYAALQLSPANIALQYYQGTDPSSVAPATLTISSDAAIPFRVAADSPWVALSTVAGVAPGALTIKPSPAGLAPGYYAANVTVTFADGRSFSVSVSLVIYGLPRLTLSGNAPSFTAIAGSAGVQSRDVTVVASIRDVTVQASAEVFSPAGGNWLSVSPSAGTSPILLHILVNPAGLTAGVYSGTIAIASSAAGNSPLSVPVSLSVLAAPAISVFAFTNAASFVSGPASPNTLVSAFGDFPGCTSGAQVTLDGVAPPVFASTPNQINFLVPPAVAGKAITSVKIACAGLTSQPVALSIVDQSPAIFTSSQSGSGQAAVVNQDGSIGPPSAPGNVVTVFGTGFGLFGAPDTDGLSRIARQVTAQIGGVPADVYYAGEAPGYTSGLQQFNLLIPATAPRGSSVPVTLRVGGVDTQPGLTLSIQ